MCRDTAGHTDPGPRPGQPGPPAQRAERESENVKINCIICIILLRIVHTDTVRFTLVWTCIPIITESHQTSFLLL